MLPRGVYRNAVQQPVLRGSAWHREDTTLLIAALRVFGREVLNGQLPSNAVTIHETLCLILPEIHV
jgi:hypothetical protein